MTTTTERIDAIRAELTATEEKAEELRLALATDERQVTASQANLHRLQLLGRRGKAADLGEAMLATQEAEAGLAASKAVVGPELEQLSAQAVALRADIQAQQRVYELEVFSSLVSQYEALLIPAWPLVDRIRAQAMKCGKVIEVRGGLLDREWRTVAGYPLQTRPSSEVVVAQARAADTVASESAQAAQ
jgi:hypothetical protein